MTTTQSNTSFQRVSSLDGLRGVAAIIVVVGHTIGAVLAPPGIAGPSVMLFFVLSGYCLSASATRGDRATDRLQFYVRRIFRIHPPFVFALLVAWQVSLIPRTGPCCDGLTDQVLNFTHVAFSFRELTDYLYFPGAAGKLMPIGWTLEVEMIFSLLLPIMVLMVRKGFWWLLLLIATAALLERRLYHQSQLYVFHFFAGIIAYEMSGAFAGIAKHGARSFGFVLLVIFAYFTAVGMGLMPDAANIVVLLGGANVTRPVLFSLAMSSMALTLAAVHTPDVRALFEWRPIVFLGRVSYSVYLLHYTVLLACLRYVTRQLTTTEAVGLVALVVGVTVLGATLMYRYVEVPSIRAGNWLCAKIADASPAALLRN